MQSRLLPAWKNQIIHSNISNFGCNWLSPQKYTPPQFTLQPHPAWTPEVYILTIPKWVSLRSSAKTYTLQLQFRLHPARTPNNSSFGCTPPEHLKKTFPQLKFRLHHCLKTWKWIFKKYNSNFRCKFCYTMPEHSKIYIPTAPIAVALHLRA